MAHASARSDADRHLRRGLGGEKREEIRAGDVVRCPPNKKHWHGATPKTAMTHIAIAEKLNGKAIQWMEHVTDEQYLG